MPAPISAVPIVPAPPCPACARRGAPSTLSNGAALDGQGCTRCGGVLLISTGSERLLHDELALSRSTLLEIAQSFGGHRFSCPACTSKMRPLVLRGVDVDLCFHCGGLWLDDGEIERLSAQRYRSMPRTTLVPLTTTADLPDATVRFSAVHPLRRSIGNVVGFNAALLALMHLSGVGNSRVLVGAVVLGVLYLLTRSRRVVDVFPRARRILRSRRLLPGLARDAASEHLDDVRFVIARPTLLGGAETEFVDSVGRTIVTIDVHHPGVAIDTAVQLGRRLGAGVLVHPLLAEIVSTPLPASATSTTTTTTTAASSTGTTLPEFAPARQRTLAVFSTVCTGPHLHVDVVHDRRIVWSLRNAVPARADQRELLSLAFFISAPDGSVYARFHDDGHGNTVVVGADGDALASIRRRRVGVWPLHTATRARSAYRLRLWPAIFGSIRIVDDRFNRHATITADEDARQLSTLQTGSDEALLSVLLFAQVLIDELASPRAR